MSGEWQGHLRAAWAELSTHSAQLRQFRTKRLSPTLALNAYAAMRAADNAPCLLIEASVTASSLFEVGGMRLGAYAGESGSLLVLTLEDENQTDLFTMVCADAVASAASGPTDECLNRFLARLDAWRRFLRERRAGLTKNETVGLLGELFLLERLLQIDSAMLLSWTAPDDGLHDFDLRGHALEAKTSLGPTNSLRISTLDQLDSSGLRHLHLVHMRLIESSGGRSLDGVIAEINRLIADEGSRRFFSNALLKRGLMPDDTVALSQPVVELRDTVAYRVDDRFPKLVRSSVPTAVKEAEYLLELRTIASHSVDFDAMVAEFTGKGP